MSLNLIPMEIKVVTISIFDTKQFYSEPSKTICIGGIQGGSQQQQEEKEEEEKTPPIEWDIMPSYFIQVTKIDLVEDEEICIKLTADKVETEDRRTFQIRDIGKTDEDELEMISIEKQDMNGTVEVDIDEDHDEEYNLGIYDENDNIN
eukprot:730993_1